MKPLSKEARALLAAAMAGDRPTAEERKRALARIERARDGARLAPGNRAIASPLSAHPPRGPVSRRRGLRRARALTRFPLLGGLPRARGGLFARQRCARSVDK